MKEIYGDLWEVEADLRVITTNGDVNREGEAVMGRGSALEAKERITGIEYHFAGLLKRYGNRVMLLTSPKRPPSTEHPALACFPVKRHWHDRADPELIRRSAEQLARLADKFGHKKVVIPRPGCGNGRLSWSEVRPLLEGLLDERFNVITFPPEKPSARRSPQTSS